MSEKLRYGNWIRWKVLVFLGLSALAFGLLGLFPLPAAVRIASELFSFVLFLSLLHPLILSVMFSPQGGDLQEKVYGLIVQKLGEAAGDEIIDIGTGNGVLAIRLGQAHPAARVTGVDDWGPAWEYSSSTCARNAAAAGLQDRLRFVKGDAARLDFGEAAFDSVVSNLTFHEVKSTPQKRDLVREALRVLKPGGRFVFVDYFFVERYYGKTAGFEDFLASQGLDQVQLQPLSEVLSFPRFLSHPKALGRVGILSGTK